jgi:hypothetical protein
MNHDVRAPEYKDDVRAPEYKEAERRTAPQQVVPTPQARAAVSGHKVRYVLVLGLAAAVVALLIVYLLYF